MPTIDELQAQLDAANAEKTALKEKAKTLAAERNHQLFVEHCDQWGLTPEEYLAAKAIANPQLAIERQLHEAETQTIKVRVALAKLAADDPQRPALEKHATDLEALAQTLHKQFIEAGSRKRPLGQVLNEARKAKSKAARNVQTAQVKPAEIGTVVKGV